MCRTRTKKEKKNEPPLIEFGRFINNSILEELKDGKRRKGLTVTKKENWIWEILANLFLNLHFLFNRLRHFLPVPHFRALNCSLLICHLKIWIHDFFSKFSDKFGFENSDFFRDGNFFSFSSLIFQSNSRSIKGNCSFYTD